ncbi:carboxyltransferase domain-containing protein [Alteromonas sp. ASW11-36]|uniref:Carboxyltransferase domain-containing protein n=1 Tax=Alteromonas arenosi TaxID=3055817 RepID=A0ABT7SXM6_9ALTE|nr:carboxyltransferase domain-containing protein [Alteromonas sp. ASW11-36]MDM7860926.1 carboxyltransferase domain-containing protein [Alteromonas sp. ASW11-36]
MNQALAQWNIHSYSECGESALILYFSGQNLRDQNRNVSSLCKVLSTNKPEWLRDLVPGFDSLMLVYDIASLDLYGVLGWLAKLRHSEDIAYEGKLYHIEVDYRLSSAFDLNNVSDELALSVEDVIDLHQRQQLRVFAIGFTPHFAYLGELPEQLKVARLSKPRVAVPAGAVAIADNYSAVYPASSPGGWQLLGTVTDLNAFLAIDLSVGDRIQFKTHSITRS